MKIKELDRTVNISWSPASHHPILLAAGTAAQQLDASFSTSAAMEIYSLNLGEPGLDMELRASAPSDYRFHKITWSSCGVGPDRETGVIVGGCDGGRLQLYSASKLLSGEDGLIVSQEKHTGPVRALDFNPYQGNLLATGAAESEIYVWDLNNMGTPMSPGAKAQPSDDVVWIAWNRQVQHILASTFTQRCVVWDLRKNEPIIKLSDTTSRVRWKVVAWHPDVATQMCLASEDDQTPVIQLWDLRFATSPLKVMQNHQRGVLSIAWCAQDPDLLVSCGKDNRILCWNPNSTLPSGEVVCDIATTNQWHFDVSWCPRNPALIASSSFDGHVSVYSLTGGTQQAQTSTKIADSFPGMDAYVQAPVPAQQQVTVDLRKPPKWLRRPVGASFGFGGKLVTFANEALPAQQQQQQPVQQPRVVYLCRVVTEPEIVARSNQLEAALQYGQFVDYCRTKVASSSTAHERAVWSFLRASFESNPRAEFLDLLGFRPDELNVKLSKFGKPANARSSPMLDGLNDRMAALGREPPDGDAAAAAFDAIAAAASNTTSRPTPPASPFKISVGDDINGLISQALLIGNIEAAVDLCLEDGRMADAIILAMTGGSDLLARTQYKYFQSKGPLSSLISAVVTEDWTQVMQSCQIESWREALAAALTYSKNEELQVLCELLGSRIEAEGKGSQQLNAQLCYICAGNLNKLIDNWNSTEKPTSLNKLQDFVELVMILQKAAEIQGHPVTISGSLAEFLSRYAAILASQGNLVDALTYLGNAQDEQVAALRDRIEKALGYKPVYAQPTAQPTTRTTRGSVSRSSAGFYPGQLQQQQPQQHQQQLGSAPSYLGTPVQQMPQQSYNSPQAQAYTPTAPVPPVRSFTPTVQQQQQQLVPPIQSSYLPGQHQSPSATSPYNTAGPVMTQQHYGPPKTFSPAPPVAPVPPVPVQQSPPVAAVQGSVRSYPSADPSFCQKLSESPHMADRVNSCARWSSNTGAGTGPRNKPYVIDPSVQSGNHVSSYGMPAPYGGGQQVYPGSPAAPLTTQPVASYPQADVYNPQEPPASKTVFNPVQPIPVPPGGAPPGWNDPPVLKNFAKNQFEYNILPQMSAVHSGTRQWNSVVNHLQPKPEYAPQNPITHPLYGSAQPDPPAANFQNAAVNGVYGNMGQQQPYVPYNAPPHAQQQQQQQQQQPPAAGPVVTAKAVEPPKPKGPIPEEHMYLQTVFDELRNRCYNTATNPQTKRKLEEVARKLEVLYDCLREHKLSPTTLTDLHQMVQMTQIGDYTGGLGLHTKLVSGPDFSQIAGFMPGLKVLLQSALQLNVYLQ
ncbi:protein transport protein Sec31A isoform X2 [Schistocerca nitens]|uniref:protein transport protein Sec31A isoform X2 n=1 Tax=Schistocerca nitens TaxID=7011 RepID=UPI0021184048|nr:protein transport protein Sec31A isoform X2 [Schistocerca nitens]